jgi:hypothetical protein
MRERVRRLSGQFQVRSGNNGTTVKATFPVPGATNQAAALHSKPPSCTTKPPFPQRPFMAEILFLSLS